MTDSSQHHKEHLHTIRSVSLGTIWRACRYPFVVLSAVIIPRFMGDTLYGEFAIFMSIYVMLDIVTDVGVTQIFGRFVPELRAAETDQVKPLLHSMLFYGIIITLLVALFGEGGLLLFGSLEFRPSWWVLLALLLITTKVEGSLFAYIYGTNRIALYSAKELIRSAATFIFVLGGFLLYGITGALWALLLNEVVLLAVALAWTRRDLFSPVHIISPAQFRPYLVFGVKFYLPMLTFCYLQRLGNMLIKTWHGSTEEVAYFDIANQYLLLTATFLGLIFTTLLPSITALHMRDEHDTIAIWHARVMTYSSVAIVITINALALMGQAVIRLCLGADFLPVFPSALIMSAALPFVLIAYAGMNVALLEKRTRIYSSAVGLGLVVMAVTSRLLIPTRGAAGAAWASVAGYCVLALLLVSCYRSEFRGMLAGLCKVLLAGVICVPFWFLGLGLAGALGAFVVSTILFVGLVIVCRIVRLSDLHYILRLGKTTATPE
jgi:O-antigen/teichoic acid export membrane protein